MAEAPNPPIPASNHHARRWMTSAGLWVLGILAALLIGLNFLLASDYPRTHVVALLQRQLGLEVNVGSLSTGLIRTSATDVAMSLPLSDEAILRVPRLRVSHTNLLSLALGSSMRIDALRFQQPTLLIRQNAAGEWNVGEAITLLARSASPPGAAADATQPPASPRAIVLPQITIDDGTILLVDQKGKRQTIHPFNLRSEADGPLAWHITAQFGPYLRLSGDVVPGQNWKHRLEFALNDAAAVLRPFAGEIQRLSAAGHWRGQVESRGLAGELRLSDAVFNTLRASGDTGLRIAGGNVTITPADLRVLAPGAGPKPVNLTGGQATIDAPKITLDRLFLGMWGGNVRLSGDANWRQRSATLDAAWINLALTRTISHSGQGRFEIQTPWQDSPQIHAAIQTTGRTARGRWEGRIDLAGQGRDWENFDWTVTLPQFTYHGRRRTLVADGLRADATQRQSLWRLHSLRLPDSDRVQAMAEYNTTTDVWWAWLMVKDAALPLIRDANATIMVNAWGDPNQVILKELQLSSGWFGFSGSGQYIFSQNHPLDITVGLWRRPVRIAGDESRAAIGGDLWGTLRVNGTIDPLSLGIDGSLRGQNVIFGSRRLGDLAVQVKGGADESQIHLRSTEFQIVDGRWDFFARYSLDDDVATVRLNAHNASLAELDNLISPPPSARGHVAGNIELTLPRRDLNQLSAKGKVNITDLRRTLLPGTPAQIDLAASKLSADIALKGKSLRVDQITAEQGDGSLTGSVHLDLGELRTLAVNLTPRNWPVTMPSQHLTFSASGSTRLRIGLADRTLRGPVAIAGPINGAARKLGQIDLDGAFGGESFTADRLRIDLLGGSIGARGQYIFGQPLQTTASATITAVDLSQMSAWIKGSTGIAGKISGNIAVAPSTDPRAIEPLRLTVTLRPENARFRGIQIGDGDFTCYAGPDRFLLHQGALAVAGGSIQPWLRFTRPTGNVSIHASAQIENVSLDQVVHAINPGANPTPGALAGRITLLGEPGFVRRTTGEALLELRDADLLKNSVIAFLYNAAGARVAAFGQPIGRGLLRARLESAKVDITNFFYSNRGLSVRGTGTIQDFFALSKSPIEAQLVGSARPFRNIRVPILADVEKVLAVLQNSLTTIRVDGTLGDPQMRIVPLGEIGKDLRSLLLGDIGAAAP